MTSFSYPPIHPLERLNVTDGLLLNAELWQLAHYYHRQRQNIHYQALNQGGIVCGLGLSLIEPGGEIKAEYRDRRWLRIQPGIAIDSRGNPIIVSESLDFHLASVAEKEPLWVYLVLRYVDPEKLQWKTSPTIVRETFRLDEKTTLPTDQEVELCRILLQPGNLELSHPVDVFHPGFNQLDLRSRVQVQAKAKGFVRVAYAVQEGTREPQREEQWGELLCALPALYPALVGDPQVTAINLAQSSLEQLIGYTLLSVKHQQFVKLNEAETQRLKEYVAQGGLIVVDLPAWETVIDELKVIEKDLMEAIADIGDNQGLQDAKNQLIQELEAIQQETSHQINQLKTEAQHLVETFGVNTPNSGQLDRHHPLRRLPFLFSQYPIVSNKPIEFLNWGGIVFIIGNLIQSWGIDEEFAQTRESIRTNHEMGINLLHFAWWRRQMIQAR
ncbi:hypothetical protein K4A83_16450 [Spirulina subsalsa FACHB-351]|uniref:DUF4159 domain-containing protein n=1 Tax=Spirulina subsalsa FACHB-351 TaxID=234711 RepID=A0ABT3L8L7_9CYAN|nr:hypothetical protein [Spirulina subsalsa]MCW6037851.1 hypothetical protein [Spirulina subsalsa FACHB-351]